MEVKPVRTATAKNVTAAFEELVLFCWEAPDILISDNRKCFDSDLFRDTLSDYGVTHVTTPPYHPQANPVERVNRVFKTMIAFYVGSYHRHWNRHLHELRHAFNTAVHSSTKVSPAFLNYRRHPRPVKSLRREAKKSSSKWRVNPELWADRLKRLDALRDLVADYIEKAHDKQARYHNRGRRLASCQVGDLVMRRTHYQSKGEDKFNAKLAAKYEGPYEVQRVLSPTVYEVKIKKNRQKAKVDWWLWTDR